MLQPIVLTPIRELDGQPIRDLVCGHRRLEACKRLGWSAVPFHEVDNLDDALDFVRAELAENAIRKDFLPSEIDGRFVERLSRWKRPRPCNV